MTIKFDKVTIRVSELQTTTVVVAPWETHLLLAMYGNEAEVTGEEAVDRIPPDPNDEFARLALRYGPKNADTPLVAAVYGKFGPGVAKLANEISAAYNPQIASGLEGIEGLELPQLTPEQIEAISAAGDLRQKALEAEKTELIPAIEPKPPIVTAPVAEVAEAVEVVVDGAQVAGGANKDPLFD